MSPDGSLFASMRWRRKAITQWLYSIFVSRVLPNVRRAQVRYEKPTGANSSLALLLGEGPTHTAPARSQRGGHERSPANRLVQS